MKVDPRKTSFAKYLRKIQTDAESLLWYRLRARRFFGIKCRRQQPINNFIVDFVSFDRKLIIEIDGGQHNEDTNNLRDKWRTKILEDAGFKVIRFWNNEVLQNLDSVLEAIMLALQAPSPFPAPSREREFQKFREDENSSPY